MARLRIKSGTAQGQTFPVSTTPIVIGRDTTCDISLQDKGASRRHAEVFSIGAMSFIRDLDSRNGSFVNDNRITEEMLRDGDSIQIGSTVITFDEQKNSSTADNIDFSEDDIHGFIELRLEDITSANVGEGDASSEKHLRALYHLSRLIADTDSEEHLIKDALPFVTQIFQADGAYLFGRDMDKGNIVTLGAHSPKGNSGQLSKTIIRKVIQDRRALLVTDAMRDDRFSSHESVVRHNIHAVICAPLALAGDNRGVLYLTGGDQTSAFNEQELELAATMAAQIGIAISNLAAQSKRREYAISALRLLLKAAEVNHPGIATRNERIAVFMLSIGKALKVKSPDLDALQLGALIHNYAVMVTPSGSVEPDKVPEESARLLEKNLFFQEVADVINNQLEHFDGSGPRHLRGGELPLSVRVFNVAADLADKFPTTSPLDPEEMAAAVKTIAAKAGGAYDSIVVDALVQAQATGMLILGLDEHWRRLREGGVAAMLHEQ
ncbi:MAG: FHA domain-containing protein [Planctomycetota bacterium]|jgi:response regulator RpfG family c-di-GMP phosphodiesterase|nr:FHA domain-containing protein [Planctomycetota bacterium]